MSKEYRFKVGDVVQDKMNGNYGVVMEDHDDKLLIRFETGDKYYATITGKVSNFKAIKLVEPQKFKQGDEVYYSGPLNLGRGKVHSISTKDTRWPVLVYFKDKDVYQPFTENGAVYPNINVPVIHCITKEFEIHDSVYDIRHGWGIVTNIQSVNEHKDDKVYPVDLIRVEFSDITKVYSDGKDNVDDQVKMLRKTEYTFS